MARAWPWPGGGAGRRGQGLWVCLGPGAGLRGGAEAGGEARGQTVKGLAAPPAHRARPQVLGLCGAAYRPTEEIDLRSVGWGNIFQLPFKHVRDFRLRHLVPFFIYSGFEVLFACTGLALVSTACVASGEENAGGPVRFEF